MPTSAKTAAKPVSSRSDLLQRRYRFVFGITLASGITALLAFPLSYLVPVFLVGILSSNTPGMSLKQGIGMIAVFIIACGVGLLLSLLLNYPVICIAVTLLLLWHIFLFAARGGSPLMAVMLTVAITVIPVGAMETQALALFIAKGLCLVGFTTVLMIWISFWIFPAPSDGSQDPSGSKKDISLPANQTSPIISATARTLMASPAIILFFYAGLTSQLLTLVFICILLQTPDLRQGVKGGFALLAANAAGGAVAIFFYNLMVAVPEWWALVLLTLLTSLLASQKIFSERPTAQLFATALSTVLLLVGSVTGSFGGEADAKFYARLVGIGLAVLYLVTAIVSVRSILISLGKFPTLSERNKQPVLL